MLKCPYGCECCCPTCPSSRAGHDVPALLVPRGPLNPSRNKLLSAASDSSRVWSGLALVWDGDLHHSQVCLEEGVAAECMFEVDDCNRRDAATLDVPAPMSPLESMPPHHSPCRPCSCDFLQLCHFQGPIPYFPQLLSCPGLSGCVWQCISALITIVMKAPFSGGAGR